MNKVLILNGSTHFSKHMKVGAALYHQRYAGFAKYQKIYDLNG